MLRLLDLTLLQNMEWNAKRHQQQQQMRLLHKNINNASRSTSGNGYYSATSSQMTSPKPDYDVTDTDSDSCTLPGYNTPHSSTSRHKASPSPPVSFQIPEKRKQNKPTLSRLTILYGQKVSRTENFVIFAILAFYRESYFRENKIFN